MKRGKWVVLWMALAGVGACYGSRASLPAGNGAGTGETRGDAGSGTGGGPGNLAPDWSHGFEPCVGTEPVRAHDDSVAALIFSQNGQLVATYSGNLSQPEIKVWTPNLALLWRADGSYTGGIPNPQSFAFSADSSTIAIGRVETATNPTREMPPARWIQLLSASDGAEREQIPADLPVTLALSPDGSLVAGGCQCSGGLSGPRLWHRDGTAEPALGEQGDQAFGVAFSPDGALLAVRAGYPTDPGHPRTSLWRVADGALVWARDIDGEQNARIAYVAFSPDGARVISVSVTVPVVRLYRTDDGELEGEIPSDTPLMALVAPGAPDVLAVAEKAGALKLWRLHDSAPIAELAGSFTTISFSPDGQRLVAGDADGFLHQFCARSAASPSP